LKKLFTILISLSFLNSYAAKVSVKDYGAKGDGVTVDSTAIKNALAAAGPMSNIFFPKGKYNLSSCILSISKDLVTLSGEKGTVIISSGIRFRAGTYPSTLACTILASGIKHLTIKDIEIRSTDDQTATYVGISLQNAPDVIIQNCSINGFALLGIRTNGADRLRVMGCHISKIGSPTSVLKDSVGLVYVAPYGMNGLAPYAIIEGNYIDSIGDWISRTDFAHGAGIYETGQGIIVNSNNVREFGAVAIKIYAAPGVVISNNIIETNSQVPGTAGCYGIISDEENMGDGSGATITGNTIIAGNNFTYGIYAASGSKEYIISKNTIYMKSYAVTAGMAFERSQKGEITSNIIIAASGNINKNFGMYITNQFSRPGVASVKNLSFVNNIISNVAYGYYLSGAQNISILGGKVSMDSIIPSACIFIRPYYVTSLNISISGVTFISKSPGYIYQITDSANSLHVENMAASGNFIYSNGNYWFVGSGNNSIHTITDHDMLGKCQLNEKYTNIRSSITHSIIKR
jgi:hypothetical protein